MNTLGLILIMVGALFIWAGISDKSIISLMQGIMKPAGKKNG